MDFLKDVETQMYLEERNTKVIKFNQYFKGCNKLGGLVESCVKLTKKLIYGTIRKNVLDYISFDFIIAQTIHLVNKRPIAFQESLRDGEIALPSPITPEILIKGFDLVTLNIIPSSGIERDLDWQCNSNVVDLIKKDFSQINKIRENLKSSYHVLLIRQLIQR